MSSSPMLFLHNSLPILVLLFQLQSDLMLADTCSVVIQEMLIFCLSCIKSVFFSHFLQFRPPISLKPLSIWHEKCTYSLVANYFKGKWKKISNMAWLTPSASAKTIAHFRISLPWQLFSNSLLLNIAFHSSNAELIFLYIFRKINPVPHHTFKIINFPVKFYVTELSYFLCCYSSFY